MPALFVSFQKCGSDGRKTINYAVIEFPHPVATNFDIEDVTAIITKQIGAHGGDVMILNWRRMEAST